MNYYTVPAVGDGSKDNPFHPDIPDGTPFVGQSSEDGSFLIATPVELGETSKRKKQLPRQALEATANARGIPYDDVMKWKA